MCVCVCVCVCVCDEWIKVGGNIIEIKSKISEISELSLSNPNHNPLDYALWSVLENKTNATSPLNIGSLKTTIAEEWNKMSDESILGICKSFRRRVDTIIEKKK